MKGYRVLERRQRVYRAALIGATGDGNYGHGLDRTWGLIPEVDVVAVADVDVDSARAKADEVGASEAFGDYGEMLRSVEPDFVTVCTRRPDTHVHMLMAAVEAGAQGIYCEKPFVCTPAEADKVIEAANSRGARIQIAHRRRVDPNVLRVIEMVESGEIGRLVSMHTTGKNDDRRGGAEDLAVLGVHFMDLMRQIAGDPIHVKADVFQSGQPVGFPDVHEGNEGIGPIAGDQIFASFVFRRGVVGTFSSVRAVKGGHRAMGIELRGTAGMISLRGGGPASEQTILVNRCPSDDPSDDSKWEPVEVAPLRWDGEAVSNEPADLAQLLHTAMARDLLQAVEQRRRPICDGIDGRWVIEMVMGIHEAALTQQVLKFPLSTRENPYADRRETVLSTV